MLYTRITRTVNDKGILVPNTDSVYKYISDNEIDHYASIFYYNEEQFKQFKETGSVVGIKNVSCNKLVWDFDSHTDLEEARADAVKLVGRLKEFNIEDSAIRTYFSGAKGLTVQVNLANKMLTPEEFRNINKTLAEDLDTNDLSITNASRILRIPGTKHQKSGLYKIPITLEQLKSTPMDEIAVIAKDRKNVDPKQFIYTEATFPVALGSLVTPKTFVTPLERVVILDLSKKPKWLTACKYAIQEGYFKEGNRNNLLTALAATLQGQGFNKDTTYSVLKSANRLQARRYKNKPLDKSEIWAIMTSVYSPSWTGGTFTCRTPGQLQEFCNSLGDQRCRHTDDEILRDLTSLSGKFQNFAINLENNIITTGIEPFDKKVTLTTSMLVGLLGAPSAGKTQTTFSILNNASKKGIKSVFFSMDMGLPLVFARLLQKHTGLSQEAIYNIYKNDPDRADELSAMLGEEYKNIKFCFQSGLSVEGMKRAVADYEQKCGDKVKLIAVDYLECVQSEYADSTASASAISQQLKDVANENEALVLLLLQTQKHSGDPSEPLLSMRNVKGSSAIEQACSVILTIYREGFSAKNGETTDKFITINAVKNRMGPLTSIDCGFEGITGAITWPLDDDRYTLLKDIRNRKQFEKDKAAGGDGWS